MIRKLTLESSPREAFDEWVINHSWFLTNYKMYGNWTPAYGLFFKKLPMVLFKIDTADDIRFCVQYAGNGHYFKTLDEAYQWIIWRIARG